MKLLKVIIGILIILIVYNCDENDSTCNIKVTIEEADDYELMYEKWKKSDICFFKSVIQLLRVDSIDDCTFSDIERNLVRYTSISVCGIDCQDESWLDNTPNERAETRRIIYLYYSVYIDSKLSMKKEDWSLCDEGVDLMKYCRNDYSFMSNLDLKNEIEADLNKLYAQCR